jgi:hypothetical protein
MGDRSMPPRGGMMPRNTDRKGSVSCGSGTAAAQQRHSSGREAGEGKQVQRVDCYLLDIALACRLTQSTCWQLNIHTGCSSLLQLL